MHRYRPLLFTKLSRIYREKISERIDQDIYDQLYEEACLDDDFEYYLNIHIKLVKPLDYEEVFKQLSKDERGNITKEGVRKRGDRSRARLCLIFKKKAEEYHAKQFTRQ